MVPLPQCYLLFIVGREEIPSRDGTTQVDPTALRAYELGVLPLIKCMLEFINLNETNAKEVTFVDNFTVAGSLNGIKVTGTSLQQIAQNTVISLNQKKSNLIVKENELIDAQNFREFKNKYYN